MQDSQSIPKTGQNVKYPPNLGGSPLVTTVISEKSSYKPFNLYKLELYPCSVKIVRPGGYVISKPGKKRAISSFTWSSKRRLRFKAANAWPALISHFGMTYHHRSPSGREVKKELHKFLVMLRWAYPGVGYLWILEFQERGTAHVHLWLTLSVSYGLHQFLAGHWNQIVEPESDEHLKFHIHSKNFIPWEMRSAGYLCKYLDKDHQKRVPDGFENVGRFWGSSRDLVKSPEIVADQFLNDTFQCVDWKPSKFILRVVCKSQERRIRKKTKWTNWGRRSKGNYTILEGRSIFNALIDYHERQSPF